MLFADENKYINVENAPGLLDFSQSPANAENFREQFTYMGHPTTLGGLFCAQIPQDFNLDVHTTGSITGVNRGDSKLLALKVALQSERGAVTARRLRGDEILLRGGTGVQVSSSLEAQELDV